MRTSSIKTPENDGIVVVRKSFIDLCGDKDAGILLSYFVYWHDVKLNQNSKNSRLNQIAKEHGDVGTQDESLFQYHRNEEIYEQCLSLLSKKGIVKARAILKKKGFLTEHKNPNSKYAFDKTIFYLLHTDEVNRSISQNDTTSESIRDCGLVEKDRAITETTTETTSMTTIKSDFSVADKSSDDLPKAFTETMLQAIDVSNYLNTKLKSSIDNFKEPSIAGLHKWAKDIDLAIRKDNRTKEQLMDAITWIFDGAGSFWIGNIQSGKKLRAQFDKLTAQMKPKAQQAPVRVRALEAFGLGKVFFTFINSDKREIQVCLFGDYGSLYDYRGNKYIDKVQADKVWSYIDEHFKQIEDDFKRGK